jgi:CheY-like chemotaxis protein
MANRTDLQTTVPPNFIRRRILIVEDEAASRTATCRYLQFRGHEVVGAATVDESFARAEALHPEVLICDWKLGGKRDGTDVAQYLQSRYGVKVIFITAYALADLRRKIHGMGVIACLRKPISLATLAAVLDAVDTTVSLH